MVLDKMITRETVKLDISDIDKWTVMEELIDLIVASGKRVDREAVHSAVFDREYQGSTGLENGIAIPHARTDGVDELVGAIGISRDGIDFESADGNPCHLVFLIVAPHQESTRYLKALSAVAYIGNDDEKRQRLISAASPEEVISVLEEVTAGAP